MKRSTVITGLTKPWLGALFVFLLALLLRTSGLSHDLQLDRIYHPDSPKQIRAAERFIDGEYYTIIGGRDYEGYPYFNSHLVALAYRAYDSARHQIREHVGLPYESTEPDLSALFVVKRLMNACWSALIALMLYLAGARYFNRATGLFAGLLFAVSPIDITAAHFATGDSTTSFFAAAAIITALAIVRSGAWWLYMAAALLTGAAFSTKYHGGMALIAALVAHLFLYPQPRRLFSAPSIGRLTVLGVSLLIGILITSPALLIQPESAFKDIVQFVQYTSSFGMTPEMAELSLWSRFLLGMQINMPVLADVLGPALVAAILLAVVLAYKKPDTWILASVPIVYILVGLATKPLTHAVYHTLATPALTLLGAVALGRLFHAPRMPKLARIVALALLTASFAYSASYSFRELFFFKHNDTRYLAETWARDNIPYSFILDTRAYTFDVSLWKRPGEEADAVAFVLSGQQTPAAPGPTFFSHAVQLEDEKLSIFRNWNQYLFMPKDGNYIRPHHRRPSFQPLPTTRADNIIFADAPWHLRTPKARLLAAPERISPTIASDEPLARILVSIHAGAEPLLLRMKVAGTRKTVRLHPDEKRLLWIERPCPVFMTRTSKHFYRTQFRAEYGSGRIFLATTELEMAWSLFHTGDYDQAHALFSESEDTLGYLMSGLLAERWSVDDPEFTDAAHELLSMLADEAVLESFGVTPAYLEQLPGITLSRDDLQSAGMLTDEGNGDRPRTDLYLEPGRYTIELHFMNAEAPVTLRLTAPWNDIILHEDLQTDPDSTHSVVARSFEVDQGHRLVRIQIEGDEKALAALETIQIRPDSFATAIAYAEWLRLVAAGEWEPASLRPLYYDLFLALADRKAATASWDDALRYYRGAIASAPHRRQAYERLAEIESYFEPGALDDTLAPYRAQQANLERHSLSVRLANRMHLTSYQIPQRTVRRGDTLRLNLYWETPGLDDATKRRAVWIHGIPKGESTAQFHGDRGLRSVLAIPPVQDRLTPYYTEIMIPKEVPTGHYTVKTGIWIPTQRHNVRVRESDIAHDKRGVFIADIEIVE